MAVGVITNTLRATPAASIRQAAAKARPLPIRRPTQLQSTPEGIAASPTASQITGSTDRISGWDRTMAEMKVAVMI